MVLALNLGGTIALSYVDGNPVALAGRDVLAATSLTVRELDPVQSYALEWSHMLELRHQLLAAYRDGERNFLILTGTDTAEDVLYFLSMVRPPDVRLLVMVSMRTATYGKPHPDGLEGALEWVSASRPGIGICWGAGIIEGQFVEKVWDGRWVFRAGVFDDPFVEWSVAPDIELSRDMPVVPIMSVGIGSSGWQDPLLRRGGFDGLIVEAFASGDVPPTTAEILMPLVAKGFPVILASRARPGLIRPAFPGLVGTSHELLASGFCGAGQLDPHRARMRLTVALSCNRSGQVKSAFMRKKEKGVDRG